MNICDMEDNNNNNYTPDVSCLLWQCCFTLSEVIEEQVVQLENVGQSVETSSFPCLVNYLLSCLKALIC